MIEVEFCSIGRETNASYRLCPYLERDQNRQIFRAVFPNIHSRSSALNPLR